MDEQIFAVQPSVRVSGQYPNIYIPLADPWDKNNPAVSAYSESDAAGNADVLDYVMAYYDLADGSGEQQQQMLLNSVNQDDQWGGASPDGFYHGPTGNTTRFAYLLSSANLDIFNTIFKTEGSAMLFACRYRESTPVNGGRIFALRHHGHAAAVAWDARYLTSATTVQFGLNNTSETDQQSAALPASGTKLMFWYVDRRDPAAATMAGYSYAEGSVVLSDSVTDRNIVNAIIYPDFSTSTGVFTIHALANNFAEPPSVANLQADGDTSDIRVINFGSSPPTDIVGYIENLAKRSLKSLAPE